MRCRPRTAPSARPGDSCTAALVIEGGTRPENINRRASAYGWPSPKVRLSRLSRNVSRNSPFGVGKLGRRIIHMSFAKDADQRFDPNLGGSSPLKAAPRPASDAIPCPIEDRGAV